jgi:hypothetical protein
LGIALPPSYRSCLVPFPVPEEMGNTNSPVWDKADALIALNRRLRETKPEWPNWLFVVGRSEGDPCGWAIDIRSPDAPVWWLEQMEFLPICDAKHEAFSNWFQSIIADLRDSSPTSKGIMLALIVWFVLSVIGIIIYMVWTSWRM